MTSSASVRNRHADEEALHSDERKRPGRRVRVFSKADKEKKGESLRGLLLHCFFDRLVRVARDGRIHFANL
jgi:hypothetical protein